MVTWRLSSSGVCAVIKQAVVDAMQTADACLVATEHLVRITSKLSWFSWRLKSPDSHPVGTWSFSNMSTQLCQLKGGLHVLKEPACQALG